MKIDPKDFVRAKVNRKVSPGEMLRALRELQEMTQAELARKSRIPQSNISAMEPGQRNIGR
ncbi:MAG: helix-turn-helix transcriptional regulator, partial [Planctomycetes bacterium]|nr:helix-turn-helix transcriptional regulator [Planctomycetota bacterium]